MHYKNQIDTIYETIENIYMLNVENETIEESFYKVSSIIDGDYSTEGLENSYSNPLEEVISQLKRINLEISKK